jgi:hypothetical protein
VRRLKDDKFNSKKALPALLQRRLKRFEQAVRAHECSPGMTWRHVCEELRAARAALIEAIMRGRDET